MRAQVERRSLELERLVVQAFRQRGLEESQLRRKRHREIAASGRILLQPGHLNALLFGKAVGHVDVEPQQRIEFFDRRRIRGQDAGPAVRDDFGVRPHDRCQQVGLRLDQPIHGSGAESGGGGDVPHRGELVAATRKLGSCDDANQNRFVVDLLLLFLPRLDELIGDAACGRTVEAGVGRTAGARPWSNIRHSTAGRRSAPPRAVIHADSYVQHALVQPVGEHHEIDIRSKIAVRLARLRASRGPAPMIAAGVWCASRTNSGLEPAGGS